MDNFTEEHAKLLLRKEWLVKIDSSKAVPYLFKFYFSQADLSCFLLVTDTKTVWAEVLNSKLLARRWRACNQASPQPSEMTGEDSWRESILDLLSKAHTIGGLADISFEVVDSNYSDFAFELECETFKWKWETCFLGHQRSSEIISKHLISPLISLNHLSFTSAQAVAELSDGEMEKTVDKLGRTARRTLDNHIKIALSKPRVATSISRMTAMFNFLPELPPIQSISEKPILEPQQYKRDHRAYSNSANRSNESATGDLVLEQASRRDGKTKQTEPESATGSDRDELVIGKEIHAMPSEPSSKISDVQADTLRIPQEKSAICDSESSPRPTKKVKTFVPSSTDDDSESENVKSRSTSAAPAGVKRTTRQPVKRGGKRF